MTTPAPVPERDSRDHFDVQHLRNDLAGRAVRGAGWTIASQALSICITIAGTIILARLLVPTDFGLVAMASSTVGIIQVFSDGGLGLATMQRGSLTHAQVSTLFWANVALSAACGAAIAAAGPAVSLFFGDERLTEVTFAIGTLVALGGLGVQHTALLRRQMRFRALAWIQVVSALTGLSVSITMAGMGFGYWALVANNAVPALVWIPMSWMLCGWRPGLPRRGVGAWRLMRFGGAASLAGVANYVSRNADNVLIGKFLGDGPLGTYDRAYQLMVKPVLKANAPITAVLAPALSRLGDDPKRYQAACVGVFRVMAYCAAPPAVALAVFAEETVALLLGAAWMDAVEPFRWLSLACAAQIVTQQAGQMFLAQGCGRLLLRYSVLNAATVTCAFAAGLPWGISGVAFSYAMTYVLVCVPLLAWMLARTPRLEFRPIARVVFPGVMLAAFLCMLLPMLRRLVEPAIGQLSAGAVAIGALVAIYALLLTSTSDGRAASNDVLRAIAKFRQRGRHNPPPSAPAPAAVSYTHLTLPTKA